MEISNLAKEMAKDLCIFEDGLDIQRFIYALEDGGEQLEKLGYSQEDIERVYEELSEELSK